MAKTIYKRPYKNGDVYEGPLVNDLPTPEGKYTFANGDVYVGDMKKCLLLTRVSTKYQDFTPQEEDLKKYANELGYEVELINTGVTVSKSLKKYLKPHLNKDEVLKL